MDSRELEALLEGGAETQTLDIKAPCPWNVEAFARDILAMSNVQNGGSIIIGVEDQTFARLGIGSEAKATYKLDTMKDQMASYADPHVNFTVEFPRDGDGREYVVIRVFPFDEQPVICCKDGRDTQKGVVYYRNRDRRTESAAVSNAHDMRDIILTAAVKMMQSLNRKGLTVQSVISPEQYLAQKLESEREGL